MDKVIVTGANGVGKSHFTARLASVRPDIRIVSFDAIKLKTGWEQKSRAEIASVLATELGQSEWILEGGPSLLPQAVERADAFVWLDPPELVRAWQLAVRPWKFIGKSRPEIPTGNVDWPLQQYKFALRSLKNRSKVRSYISDVYETSSGLQKWRCRNERDRNNVINEWAKSAV